MKHYKHKWLTQLNRPDSGRATGRTVWYNQGDAGPSSDGQETETESQRLHQSQCLRNVFSFSLPVSWILLMTYYQGGRKLFEHFWFESQL